jgi:DNA-binding NtrC family response regulator
MDGMNMIAEHPQPVVTAMHATDFPWATDVSLVRRLTSSERRPNLLIQCSDAARELIVSTLLTSCEPPFHACRLPGPLDLPLQKTGTLFLDNVGTLSLHRQIGLQDWISRGIGQLQVVSIAAAPLYPLVLEGRFLEGLFYRLNIVALDAQLRRM